MRRVVVTVVFCLILLLGIFVFLQGLMLCVLFVLMLVVFCLRSLFEFGFSEGLRFRILCLLYFVLFDWFLGFFAGWICLEVRFR